MSAHNHGGPAFPVQEFNADGTPATLMVGMTLRQYAAIHLRVPNSGDDWLDDMIREARWNELTAKVMQGLAADPNFVSEPDVVADISCKWATAMLAARGAE